MVEVVQDFLAYVQSGFDLNRQDILSFHTDLDDAECCLLSEDASDPVGGRQVVRMKDLLFNEVLDVPFEEKNYYLQLEEFGLRCQRVVPQIDMQLVEAQRMILHQPHCQSKRFVQLLKVVTDELNRALLLMQRELEVVWLVRFEPFFYPEAVPLDESGDGGDQGLSLGCSGFLDLNDMFLTAKLLVRHVADIVGLIASASHCLPETVLNRQRLMNRDMAEEMREFLVQHLASSPRLRASLPPLNKGRLPTSKQGARSSTIEQQERVPSKDLFSARTSVLPECTSAPMIDRLAESRRGSGVSISGKGISRLNEAMRALDQVVVIHLTELTSDMHRQMYQAFVRMCQFYVRWKRAFETERAKCRGRLAKQRRSQASAAGRESMESPSPRMSVKAPKGTAGHANVRRYSQQPNRARTGSLAVPGAPAAGGLSPDAVGAPPSRTSEGGAKNALRPKKPGRAKTTVFSGDIDVRTYEQRASVDEDAAGTASMMSVSAADDNPSAQPASSGSSSTLAAPSSTSKSMAKRSLTMPPDVAEAADVDVSRMD